MKQILIKPILQWLFKWILQKPFFALFAILAYFIKSPWKIGAFIVIISLIIGTYNSILIWSPEPFVRYLGSMTLNTGTTISENIVILSLNNPSWWGIFMCWINIISAIYMFFLLWIGISFGIKKLQGDQVPDAGTFVLILIFIILATNLFVVGSTGEYPKYFGFGGFVDLGQYLIDNKDYIEGLINQTGYGSGIGGTENLIPVSNGSNGTIG